MTTFRMIARANDPTSPIAVGTIVDFDADTARTQSHYFAVGKVGPSTARPTATDLGTPLQAGVQFVDTTLSKVIFYDGVNWRDPFTGSAV